MIVEVKENLPARISDIEAYHGKIEIEVNGFKVDSLERDGEYICFFEKGNFVLDAKICSRVELKIWKELIIK